MKLRGLAPQKVHLIRVPINVTVTSYTNTTITLQWTSNPEPSFSYYSVYVSTDNSTYDRVTTNGSLTTNTYTVTGLTPNNTYYIQVTATDTSGIETPRSDSQTVVLTTFVIPEVQFSAGQASTYDLSQHYTIPAGETYSSLSLIEGNLDTANSGVSLSSSQQRLEYNGIGGARTISGLKVRLTTSSNTLESDWQTRISDSNVVWYHDFETDAEVNNFRWSSGYGGGNDPQALGGSGAPFCRRIATDGIRGSCLEIVRRAGTSETSYWWRPMSPIVGSGNGRGVNDPGANGTLQAQNYSPSNGGSQIANWSQPNSARRGVYCHPSQATGSGIDGTEYYLQLRIKMDPNRIANGNPNNWSNGEVGKAMWQTTTYRSNVNQELVLYSGQKVGSQNYLNLYRGWDYGPISGSQTPQENSELGFCDVTNSIGNCWYYSGGWDTLMFHHIPGPANGNSTLRIYAAHPGEYNYTKIWDQTWVMNPVYDYEPGYNAIILANWINSLTVSVQYYIRFCQVIFSKGWIPCPQV